VPSLIQSNLDNTSKMSSITTKRLGTTMHAAKSTLTTVQPTGSSCLS